jgi:hypothetical protein
MPGDVGVFLWNEEIAMNGGAADEVVIPLSKVKLALLLLGLNQANAPRSGAEDFRKNSKPPSFLGV